MKRSDALPRIVVSIVLAMAARAVAAELPSGGAPRADVGGGTPLFNEILAEVRPDR